MPPCIVLALPNSGPFAQIASKIERGAKIAAGTLAKNGVPIELKEIDTEGAAWLTTLASLPSHCAVVGGPLQEKKYTEARTSGLLQKKIFFTFTPALHDGDEGKLAWRFFPSPEDQMEALINFATKDLNIRSFGVFYPDDNYGRRMADIFEKALLQRHMSLVKEAYNPGQPASWSTAAERLINPVVAEDGKTMVPQTSFEALFLPESWKKADQLNNSLIYNGEDRLVLLGPMLWEQSLLGKKVTNARKFALAVFPGAWNPRIVPSAIKDNNPDFWVALGYDFINFAVNTALYQKEDAKRVTEAAQNASSSIRAIAPVQWDNLGHVKQNLYLFQVDSDGMKLLDKETFLQTREAINEKAALRMQGGEVIAETEPASEPPVLPENMRQVPEPLSPPPGSPALSTVPIPSYKLSLPGQK